MLYSKYEMYGGMMEILIPSYLKKTESLLSSQYLWVSDDKKTMVNVTRGNADLSEGGIDEKFNGYYRGFKGDIKGFECIHIRKRDIYKRPYGEIRYRSKMMGYDFFNMFMLGTLGGRELIFTIQCIENSDNMNLHIFENISDSLKVIGKEGGKNAD